MITRLEIIDHTLPVDKGGGRTVLVSPDDGHKITYLVQDGGRTLKVFIAEKE